MLFLMISSRLIRDVVFLFAEAERERGREREEWTWRGRVVDLCFEVIVACGDGGGWVFD